MAAVTSAMPRQKLAGGPFTAWWMEPAISSKPASVNSSPGTSDDQRRPRGLPSNITHSGIVPMTSAGNSVPASRMDQTSSR